MSEVFVLPSIDGDPGETFPNSRFSHLAGTKWTYDEKNHVRQYQRVMERLLALFEESGLQGKVTWFLNEGDVGWSAKYKTLIRDMVRAGYEIGLHTHVGSIFRDAGLETLSSGEQVYEIMMRTKEELEGCLGQACLSHRFGCYYQTKTLYSLVKRMGLRILSDVNPGVFLRDLEGHILDNANVPINVLPWRHDEGNWLDFGSRKGHFLHIPVCAAGITGDPLLEEGQPGNINGREIKNITPLNRLVDKARRHAIKCLCWDIHPHEIQTLEGAIDVDKDSALRDSLAKIEDAFHPKYVTFGEFESMAGVIA